MALTEALPVYRDVYKLIRLLFDYSRNFSREYKYTLGQDIKRDSIMLVCSIYRANRSVIKPYRTYISNRAMGNFYDLIAEINRHAANRAVGLQEIKTFICRANSYLGFMIHHSSYRYRSKIISRLSPRWWQEIATTNRCRKFIVSRYPIELREK